MLLTDLFLRLIGRYPAPAAGSSQIDDWLQQGYRCQHEGQHALARQLFEQALDAAPDNVDAGFLLGSLLGQNGELEQAAIHLERAVAIKPDFAGAHAALANVRLLQDDKPGALASYEHALSLDPNDAAVHSNFGLLLQACGKRREALQEFQLGYRLAPDLPDIIRNLTLIHVELEQYDSGLAFLEPILRDQPRCVEALKCKGYLLQKTHKPDQALGYYEQARSLGAHDPELLNNLGIVLQDLGRLDAALDCYNGAIALKPDFPLAIWHRSLAYLLRHDFARGWPDYDIRLSSLDLPKRSQHYPQWDGGPLAGCSILVYAEQGLGDEIMFASCLPEVIAASKHCIVECTPKLEALFRHSFPAATVRATTPSSDSSDGTDIDLQAAIGTLPRYLRRNAGEFPRHHGYLRADAQRISLWRERLSQLGPGLKVGISWQGGTLKTRQQTRSLPLARWLPLLRTPGVCFVNLQYTDCRDELDEFRAASGIKIDDWQEVRDDYEHTAALVSELDLVISVCTAVIHLSGALSTPVWIMAPYSPEWRYGIAGEKMPWYPAARVFRQPEYGQWDAVLDSITRELASLALTFRRN